MLVSIPIIIITPPIVGVPDFLIIWSIGPSCRIGPVILFSEKILHKNNSVDINESIQIMKILDMWKKSLIY